MKTEKMKWGSHGSKLSSFPSRNANFYSACAAQYAQGPSVYAPVPEPSPLSRPYLMTNTMLIYI
jgi:hypothetical protein